MDKKYSLVPVFVVYLLLLHRTNGAVRMLFPCMAGDRNDVLLPRSRVREPIVRDDASAVPIHYYIMEILFHGKKRYN